jgi:release factor glutamine methyltransferase
LALEIPGAEIIAGDISFAALLVARENSVHLGASVRFACLDVMDAISGKFDFIVSNPPYVRRSEITSLQREVREFEPQVALFSPDDELAIYRRLVDGAQEMLKRGGHLIMEIGIRMDERVQELFGPKWQTLPVRLDLQGIPRTVIGRLL